jgi:phage recombination protein Bet
VEIDTQELPAAAVRETGKSVILRSPDMQWLDIPREQIRSTLRSSLYPGARPESVDMVLDYCAAANLNVMLKPVHIVPMYVKKPGTKQGEMQDVIMPGITHYRTQASRTNTYLGKSEPEFGPMIEKAWGEYKLMVPEWCRITVKRLVGGHVAEFTAIEFWDENYATAGRDTTTPNAMWKKRPKGQLAKCTEAQALRIAFPELVGGETAEEMEGKVIDLTAEDTGPRKQAAVASLDQFAGTAMGEQAKAADPEPEDAEVETIKEVDDTPEMPGEAYSAFFGDGDNVPAKPDWKPGWKWLNETLEGAGAPHYTQGVKSELAERYGDLLWSVHDVGGKQQKAVLAFVQKHGMVVPPRVKVLGDGAAE